MSPSLADSMALSGFPPVSSRPAGSLYAAVNLVTGVSFVASYVTCSVSGARPPASSRNTQGRPSNGAFSVKSFNSASKGTCWPSISISPVMSSRSIRKSGEGFARGNSKSRLIQRIQNQSPPTCSNRTFVRRRPISNGPVLSSLSGPMRGGHISQW